MQISPQLAVAAVTPLLICIKLSVCQLSALILRRWNRVTHATGRSSSPVYIEKEWQLVASVAQDAFGVSAR